MPTLILERSLRNTNQQAFIDLRLACIWHVIMHFTVVQECIFRKYLTLQMALCYSVVCVGGNAVIRVELWIFLHINGH